MINKAIIDYKEYKVCKSIWANKQANKILERRENSESKLFAQAYTELVKIMHKMNIDTSVKIVR